jgi:Tfp pilus assembly protein PilO
MFNMSLEKTDRICLMAIAFITLISAALVFRMTAEGKNRVAREDRQISQGLKALKITEQNAEQLETALDEKKKALAQFNKKIPETLEFGEFMDQLDSMMRQRDVSLISVQPRSGVPEKTLTRIPVQMLFNGTFVNIFNLIHTLETTGRTVVMEKITIAKSNSDNRCRVELLTSIFSR